MLLHPIMLAWLTGAAVPLVLHLLARSHYRAVPWGAMMFLTGNGRRAQYSVRFKQWVLLLLRMGIVGLLAVALARPVISSRYSAVPTAGLTTAGPAAVVIILDDSASMGYQVDGKRRLDAARQVTLQILTALKRGDQAALLLAGSREYQPPTAPNADLQSIAGRVADLQPDIGQADFSADLVKAADLLDPVGPVDREIYLICDRQASNWRNVPDTFWRQWLGRKSASPLPRLTVIPVGGEESDNLAVESLEFPDHAAIRDQSISAQVRIHNYGGTIANGVPISVWSGGRTFLDSTVSIAPHATAIVNVPTRFFEEGSRVMSAAIKSSGLTSDDRLDDSVDVLNVPRVLYVTRGNGSATTRQSDEWIQPPARRGDESTAVNWVGTDDLNIDELRQYNVVVLADIAMVNDKQLAGLKTFLFSGGGVLLLAGDKTTAEEYNATLCSSSGILPAKIKSSISKLTRPGSFDRQQLLFHLLPDKPDPQLIFPINRFFPATPMDAGTRILARTSSGNPLLLESSVGAGRVVMFTAGGSPHAGPLMQMILRYLGTRSAVDRNLWPGQPIIASTADPVEDRSATVQFASGGPREPATLTHINDHTEIRFNKTARPGLYRLRYRTGGKEKLLNYVMNMPHADSDLTALTEPQWKTLAGRLKFDRLELAQTSIAATLDLQRDGREIWIDLLGGVLLLMTAEMLLSRWWTS